MKCITICNLPETVEFVRAFVRN